MPNLLIVSSSPLRAATIAIWLGCSQLQITTITPSECIIEACRRQRFELIIFLELSPYFTSMNIIEYMRQWLDYRPSIYVLSDSHSQSTILLLLECGVDQYMTFPVNLYRLRKKVYTHLFNQ